MSETHDERQFIERLAQTARDEQNARAEMAWHVSPRPVDPMIELADQRGLPPGHIAFLGDKALKPFKPE